MIFVQLIIRELAVDNELVWIIPVFAIVAFVLSIILGLIVIRHMKRIVRKSSPRYQKSTEILSKYEFEPLFDQYEERFFLPTKHKYDRFDPKENMLIRINRNRFRYNETIAQLRYNSFRYKALMAELDTLPPFYSNSSVKMPRKIYTYLEKKVCNELMPTPIMNAQFYERVSYTSPKGQNSYYKEYIFSDLQIEALLSELKIRDEQKLTAEYQRSLMSPKLRYRVLCRDKHRCTICGRTQNDGVKLHVDHIKPISKGGKTVMSNLRTLCDECNLGKSDSWNQYGIN